MSGAVNRMKSHPLSQQEKTNDEEINFSELLAHRPRAARPRPSPPPRTTLWVLALMIFGTVFLVLGISEYFSAFFKVGGDSSVGLSMIILGAIMFIPGSYGCFIIYGTYRGWHGYSYNQIPNYDEEVA
jgi:hypothetical protein